ncbi:MAG: UDP-N-acetylmuramate dehydrogenase [Caldisericia bacterium]|nr:UDP-N-acetylmuramate dehydrogenase [Caldisericia bacterium]
MKRQTMDFSFFSGNVLRDESLKPYNTFGIGGKANYLVQPKTPEDVVQTIRECDSMEAPYCIVGCGSNILFSDEDYPGVVIDMKDHLTAIHIFQGNLVFVQAGVLMQSAIQWFLQNYFTGYTYLAGIPGTIGGCIAMNAGTNRGRIHQIVHTITYFDGTHLQEMTGKKIQDSLFYRNSVFLEKKWCILSALLKLEKGDIAKEKKQLQSYLQKRNITQPLHSKSAGCFWKNPPHHTAGKILEELGLKGFQMGNVKISERHANFILNMGEGTCREVLALAEKVEDIVYQKTGIVLDREVQQVSGMLH